MRIYLKNNDEALDFLEEVIPTEQEQSDKGTLIQNGEKENFSRITRSID